VNRERVATLVGQLLDAMSERDDGSTGDPWVSQHESPLGAKLHCRLVRSGALPGSKVGRRVLVRKSDLDGYIELHRVEPRQARDELDRELEELGFGGQGQNKQKARRGENAGPETT